MNKKNFIILLCVLFPLFSVAKGGGAHFEDMEKILPYDSRKCGHLMLFELFRQVNAYLDYPNELMDVAADVFNYPKIGSMSALQREQLNAFVTILYSVHLIGDHTTYEKSVILNLRSVVGELFKAIENFAGKKSLNNINAAKKLRNQLQPYVNNPNQLLVALQKFFPEFFLSLEGPMYNYKEKFKNMGYLYRK